MKPTAAMAAETMFWPPVGVSAKMGDGQGV
jgi:hypothetical protein